MGKWALFANERATGVGIILRGNPALPGDIYIIVYIYSLMHQRRPARGCISQGNSHTAPWRLVQSIACVGKELEAETKLTEVFLFLFLFYVFAYFQESLHFPLEIAPASPFSVYTSFTLSITCLAPNSNGLHTLLNSPVPQCYPPYTPSTFENGREATEQAQGWE